MFPAEILVAYLAAVLFVVVAPGPDNILAISRGLSQGWSAAAASSVGAGLGIMVHTVAATLGLAVVLLTSPLAFLLVKVVGAAYLLWLGYKAITSRSLISFEPAARQPLRRVFATGLLSNVLNPKPGLFVVAFIPQFVSLSRGSVQAQMLVYGAIFAVLTAIIFTLLGGFSSQLSGWLARRKKVLVVVNVGAGLTFVAAGLSILALDRRSQAQPFARAYCHRLRSLALPGLAVKLSPPGRSRSADICRSARTLGCTNASWFAQSP